MTAETRTFDSREALAHHLLDELLPHCSNGAERVRAAILAAYGAAALWRRHAG